MTNYIECGILIIQLVCSLINGVSGFCWKPNTTPFYGPPKANRVDGNDLRVRVEWGDVFNNGPGCESVDFLIMTHPRDNPSAYTLSDFTLKGQRSATLQLEGNGDYVFQVIAREDKGELYGIDYKYSEMITNYGDGKINNQPQQSSVPSTSVNQFSGQYSGSNEISSSNAYSGSNSLQSGSSSTVSNGNGYDAIGALVDNDFHAAEAPPTEYTDSSPWYIYECLPFLKDINGFPDYSSDAPGSINGNNENGNKIKHNQALVDFIRHTNKNPLELVNEFLESKKAGEGKLSLSCSPSDSGGSVYSATYESTENAKVGKGYVIKKDCAQGSRGDVEQDGNQMCCASPWSNICNKNDQEDCFRDFFVCDGGKCIPNEWRDDGWPDCLDSSDESSGRDSTENESLASLPQQLVCVQCAGVILSAGFICRESDQGLTNDCLQETMGKGGACNPCIKLYLNLP